jgi:hypothetical protein
MVAALTIPVANVAQLVGLGMTTIEVWRSTDEGNSYQEVTSGVAGPATLVSDAASTLFRMGNKLLILSVDGDDPVSITFGMVLDYWTPAQVATRINELIPSLATVEDGCVVLTSPTVGRSSTLGIVYNDAEDLGWVAGQGSVGTTSRITLEEGTLFYQFSDVSGVPGEDRYKWRFSDNGLEPISAFAPRVFGLAMPVDPSLVSIATGLFVGLDGAPKRTTVVVVMDEAPKAVSGFFAGSDAPATFITDDKGFLQIPLLRGAKVRVAVEGTSFARGIIVPDEDSFDLLSAMSSAPDPFTPQATLPFLIRRSL